jgi:hypothetical protein
MSKSIDDISSEEIKKFLIHALRGEPGAAMNVLNENLARNGLDAKTLLFAAKVCHEIGAKAAYGSGFMYGASTCESNLQHLATELGKYLDQFGRP